MKELTTEDKIKMYEGVLEDLTEAEEKEKPFFICWSLVERYPRTDEQISNILGKEFEYTARMDKLSFLLNGGYPDFEELHAYKPTRNGLAWYSSGCYSKRRTILNATIKDLKESNNGN